MKARELAELLLRVPDADVRFLVFGHGPVDADVSNFPLNSEANVWLIIPPREIARETDNHQQKKDPMTEGDTATRAEHLQWCKDRALAYCEEGYIGQAVTSMASDMRKHSETASHIAIDLMFQMLFGGHFRSPEDCAKFIRGFN